MFEVEAYQRNESTIPVVLEYVAAVRSDGLTTEAAGIYRYILMLQQHGAALPTHGKKHARIIDKVNRIYELRPGRHRVAYAEVRDGKFVLLHAWRKRTPKLDGRELRQAQKNLVDWIKRGSNDES